MKRYTKTIQGIEVQFILIGIQVGWLCNFKGKEYGDYVVLEKKPKRTDEKNVIDAFEVIEEQAESTIKKLKEVKMPKTKKKRIGTVVTLRAEASKRYLDQSRLKRARAPLFIRNYLKIVNHYGVRVIKINYIKNSSLYCS